MHQFSFKRRRGTECAVPPVAGVLRGLRSNLLTAPPGGGGPPSKCHLTIFIMLYVSVMMYLVASL